MGNRGKSEPNFFGGYTHYDEKGHKIGRSEPGLFGGYTDYDASGRKIGHTDPGFLGGYNHSGAKPAIANLVSLEVTIIMTLLGSHLVPVILDCSVVIVTTVPRAAMLQHVCMAPMIAQRCGRYAASGISSWQSICLAVGLFGAIIRSAQQ